MSKGATFGKVLAKPDAFVTHAVYGKLAKALIEEARKPEDAYIPLRDTAADYAIYGESHIEAGARTQMDIRHSSIARRLKSLYWKNGSGA